MAMVEQEDKERFRFYGLEEAARILQERTGTAWNAQRILEAAQASDVVLHGAPRLEATTVGIRCLPDGTFREERRGGWELAELYPPQIDQLLLKGECLALWAACGRREVDLVHELRQKLSELPEDSSAANNYRRLLDTLTLSRFQQPERIALADVRVQEAELRLLVQTSGALTVTPLAPEPPPLKESAEDRQDRRLRECEDAGLKMPDRQGQRLPNGVGAIAKSMGISRPTLSADLFAALKRRWSANANAQSRHLHFKK